MSENILPELLKSFGSIIPGKAQRLEALRAMYAEIEKEAESDKIWDPPPLVNISVCVALR